MLSLPETLPTIPLVDQRRLIALARILESRGCPFNDIHKWLMAVYLLGYGRMVDESGVVLRQQIDAAITVMAPK